MASRNAAPEPTALGTPETWREALLQLGQTPDLLTLAETFAGIPPDLAPEDRQALTLVALLVLLAAQDGHTRLPLTTADGEAIQARLALFTKPGVTIQELLERPALTAAFGTPAEPQKPFVRTADWLASGRLSSAEQSLGLAIRTLLARRPSGCFHHELALPDFKDLFDAPVHLSNEQRTAVSQAVAGPFTLLTGGPGTGKTSIVVAILRAALRAGLDPREIALAAPTGKAAQRMGESLRGTLGRIEMPSHDDQRLRNDLPEPQTLHRLLSFLPARQSFRHHRNNPLPHRLVVVDESSMIGLELMDGLLGALGPQARLVLLGDAEQLPSVEAGAVFRDLVEALPAATVRLTHSYRMDAANPEGRSVLLTARALRAGDQSAMYSPEALTTRSSRAEIQGRGAEHLEVDDRALKAFLLDYRQREIIGFSGFQEAADRTYHPHQAGVWSAGDEAALEALFQAHEHAKILCPLREVPTLRSVAGLNQWLHRQVAREAGGALDRDLRVYAGEPIMVTINDYRRNLFNGDQGIVVKAHLDGGVHQAVAFRTTAGFRLLTYRPLQAQLELAWALTVHKSQGSEYDRVVLVLPPADSPLLTREILYTALTRARTTATILGNSEALSVALRTSTIRFTCLADALAGR